MKENYCKTKLSTIALILVLTLSAILFALPAANAQATSKSYAYIGAAPNPIGVNQEVLLHVGITQLRTSVELGWEGLSVTIEKPDGETETISDIRTDATGGTGVTYTPTMVGTYKLQSHFPGQTIEVPRVGNVTYLASDSEVLELVVQEEAVPRHPGFSLPSEYWTRPISAEFREWHTIAGNWLVGRSYGSAAGYVPYNDDAPETAHILWIKPLQMGGLAGGATGDHAFECGDAYEGLFSNSIIIGGVLYYNKYKAVIFTTGYAPDAVVAVDLHTGEELWTKQLITPDGDVLRLSFGQTFYWDSYNYHAVFPYLWATYGRSTWHAFDTTGAWVYSMENMPSGTTVYGPKGEIYIYTVNTRAGWMTLWNSSRVVSDKGSWLHGHLSPGSGTFDATQGIEWNVSIPTGLQGSVRATFFENRIIGGTAGTGIGSEMGTDPVALWGINLKPDQRGNLLFNTTWTPPSDYLTIKSGAYDADLGVFTLNIKETRTHYGFSMDTGAQLWGPTKPSPYQDTYRWGEWHYTTAYGIYYSVATSGIVYAYDMETGNLLWTYAAVDPYVDAFWMQNWGLYTAFITDGKLYVYHTEHSSIDPKPRGAPFICLNATSGDEIFKIEGLRGTYWGGTSLIGDSIIAFHNTYDQQIYAIGKGPTQTTVSIKNNVISQGSSVLIEGTVMDISPGTSEYALTARFPNGVPAVADEAMTDWMQYVYLQYPTLSDVEGVEVFLKILDPSGDWYSATVTTNKNGVFTHLWTPAIVGEYQVTAMFEGSKSYYRSEASTAFGVDQAPADPSYQGPSAEEIAVETAQRTISMLPPYPDVPTQEAIADDAARRTIAMLPAYPTLEMPAYLTMDLVILIVAAVGVVIGLIAFMALRKQK